MSKSIDERVVQMQFENLQFEKGIKQSTDSLTKLDKALELKNGKNGLSDIDTKARSMNFATLVNAVKTVSDRFSTLGQVGMRVLQNITDSVMRAGSSMLKAFTLDPIMSGFQEYETQIGAIQTILANTASKGSTLTQVNQALDELNTYADKTIYNFTEMTKNIGTFTSAGVDLQTSVDSIKGIANLAAVSGSSATQASTAMYQLSQAIAAGRVQLMDWNSVVNAGMGGELFQNALKRTAENFGTNVDAMISKYGSFRESLTQGGWLTTEVLTETLKQLSGAYTEADLLAQGYSEEQAKQIVELAETAVDAATKVKTFSQLIDTMKEAVQSGWTNTWEIIIGDFDEAQELLTKISDTLGGMIQQSADARNQFLSEGLSSGWKQLLDEGVSNEDDFIDSIKNVAKEHGIAIDEMVNQQGSFTKTLDDGWVTSEILSQAITSYTDRLSSMSAEELKASGYTEDHVRQLQELKAKVDDGSISLDEFIMKMERPSGRENVIDALGKSFDYLMQIIAPIKQAFTEVFPPATGEQLYQWTVKIKEFADGLTLSSETANKLKSVFKGLFSAFDIVGQAISSVLKGLIPMGDTMGDIGSIVLDTAASIGDYITNLDQSIKAGEGFSAVTETISDILTKIHDGFTTLISGVGNFKSVLSTVGNTIGNVFNNVLSVVKNVADWIRNNISAGDIFAGLAGGGIFVLAKKLSGLIGKISDIFDKFSGGAKEGGSEFSDLLDGIHESLESFQEGIKVTSIVAIAAAVTLLVSSLEKLGALNIVQIGVGLGAIKLMIMELNSGLSGMIKSLQSFNTKGLTKASIALIALAEAVNILADAVVKLSGLNLPSLAKGLTGVGVGIAELVAGLKFLDGVKVNLTTSIALIALAEAAKMLGDAVQSFASLDLGSLTKGLTGMGVAIGELTAAISVLGKFGNIGSLLGSLGILIAVQGLDEIATGLSRIGSLSWDEIAKGLAGMGGAFGELTVALSALSIVGGFGALLGGGAILVAVQGLSDIAEGLQQLGSMPWDEMSQGLQGMGGALAELTVALGALSIVGGFGAILGGGAILIAVQALQPIADALQQLGSMTWEEIGRGLTAMGLALLEIAGISGGLGVLAGLAGIIGGGALLLTVQSLDEIADALQELGSMSWDEIGRGLSAMGTALTELALGGFANTFAVFGAGAIETMAGSLGTLADSVKKWTDVSVPEGLGTQLASLATGVSSFNFSGWGADAIAAVAEPLGQLATSVQKWSGVTVPSGIGDQLNSLAGGVALFWTASFGAGAINTVAQPLGQLADSVKKWSGVSVPENMQEQLTGLARGVEAFSFAFMGGFSINTIIDPLKNLPTAIEPWQNVKIPENIESDLKSLANGVNAFTLSFAAGWSVSSIIDPLTQLADVTKKWTGISFPNLGADLTSFANALSVFNHVGITEYTVNNLSNLATVLQTTFANALAVVSTSLNTLVVDLQAKSTVFMTIAQQWMTSMTQGVLTGSYSLQTTFTTAIQSILTLLQFRVANFKMISDQYMQSMITAVQAKSIMYRTLFVTLLQNIVTLLQSKVATFRSISDQYISEMISAVQAKAPSFSSSISSMLDSGLSAAQGYADRFRSIGEAIGDGMAEGVLSKAAKVAEAAAKMASDSYNAAMSAIDAHSPSRLFRKGGSYEPMGFALGIYDKMHLVEQASEDMGKASYDSMKTVLSGLSSGLDSSIKTSPVIRPVLDLGSVEKDAPKIASMLSGRTLDLSRNVSYAGVVANSIRSSYDRQNSSNRQNGSNQTAQPASFNFTQNNYSPKALSNIEIYRQTRNLVSQAKAKVSK